MELKIKENKIIIFFNNFSWRLHTLLEFLGLRSKRKYWGIIYDSVSKQPLDPALVKLVYLGSNKTRTCITDMQGRYGFLAEPGKFKILVQKSNYKFPSDLVKSTQDEIYDYLYHGEFFELSGDSEVIGPNVPMDPLKKDWNQEAKKSRISYHPYVSMLLRALVSVIVWCGLLLSAFYIFLTFPRPSLIACGFLFLILFLFLLSFIAPKPKLWGKITSNQTENNLENYLLELGNPKVPNIVFGKTSVNKQGKFLLLTQPGKYVLHIKKIGQDKKLSVVGSINIKVPSWGVVANNFYISS